jgi:multidrug efflux pump subunit AcrA (membrane-fusion protein)
MTLLRRYKIQFIAISCLAIAIAVSTYLFLKTSDNEDVTLGVVKKGDVTQRVLIAGTIFPKRSALIAAPYDGYIRKLFVRVGDKVTEGNPLVTISQLPHSLGETLFPLLAPFSGEVVLLQKSEGEYIEKVASSSGRNVILRLDDTSAYTVSVFVPEIDHGKLKIGQSTEIKVTAIQGARYNGKITNISRAPKISDNWDSARVEYPIEVSLLDPDDKITSGQSVMINVVTNEVKNVLVIAHNYVTSKDGKYFLTNQKGEILEIQIGLENEEYLEIKSGATEGMKVRPIDYLTL